MKKVLSQLSFALIIAVIAWGLPFCKKDKNEVPQNNPRQVTVQMSGAQEVPAVNTTGSGTAEITFDPVMKMVSYTINWSLGSPTSSTVGMHFHGGENGSDAASSPVVVPFTGFTAASTGTFSGMTRELTDAEINQLLAGKWYVNVHSNLFPAGEIRGNIKFPEGTATAPY